MASAVISMPLIRQYFGCIASCKEAEVLIVANIKNGVWEISRFLRINIIHTFGDVSFKKDHKYEVR